TDFSTVCGQLPVRRFRTIRAEGVRVRADRPRSPDGPETGGAVRCRAMAEATRPPTRGARRPFPVAVWVVTGILAVTGVLAAFAWSLNDHTEHRLLREELEQAGGTLMAASDSVRQSLGSAAIAA